MADKRQLIGVTHTQVEDRGEYWLVHTIREYDDNTTSEGGHAFAKDILEWRAAEYGIDPADSSTLLDIVLVECYLTPEEADEGKTLLTASTTDEAREAHLARIVKAKKRLKIITRARNPEPQVRSFLADRLGVKEETANELDFVRVGSDLDVEIVAIKARMARSNIEMHQLHQQTMKDAPKRSRKIKFLDLEEEMNHG